LYCLIGNLCLERALRVKFASDNGGILSQVVTDFKTDVKARKFDWLDMATKQLAVFINCAIEEAGQHLFHERLIEDEIQELIKHCKCSDKLEREILDRSFNLLSKMCRNPKVPAYVVKQKHTLFKSILYFHQEFEGGVQMNALRTLHPLMKQPDFKKICTEEHKFTTSTFDTFVK